ncbi:MULTISPECIES: TetR/AcrR family transcriptional regulator [Pseudomonas]|jgi:AcrR family transcriptional regulator|uniref:TetR/AcrR family transcriptional regulator n=1 Tax=Pseudomonas TaxID=286 RepID=UPI00257E6164|nr:MULTISPECIES: TetR/AcrR family transcriptional regulator [Pseudomonas]
MESTPPTVAAERLLESARRLFCREGIHATGVSRLLSDAKVARRTLYETYGSKENLLRAVFDREAAMWFGWFDQALPQRTDDPEQRLIFLFDLLEEWFASGRFFGCLFTNAVAEHDKSSSWVRDLAQAHFDRVHDRIEQLAAACGLPEPAWVAQQISLLIDGAIATAMVSRNARSAQVARSILLTLLREAKAS